RVDVVHEQDGAFNRRRGEGVSDVAAARLEREPALPGAAGALEERLARDIPLRRERPRELLRRVIAALAAPPAIRRHERQPVDIGTREPLCDDARELGTEPAQTALLPAADDLANSAVV